MLVGLLTEEHLEIVTILGVHKRVVDSHEPPPDQIGERSIKGNHPLFETGFNYRIELMILVFTDEILDGIVLEHDLDGWDTSTPGIREEALRDHSEEDT